MSETDSAAGSSPTDEELLSEYTRMLNSEGTHQLQVGVVRWEGHMPRLVWKTTRRWQRPPTPARLTSALQRVLQTSRFFRICHDCGKRNNAGHMEGHICHSCMEKVGVVF